MESGSLVLPSNQAIRRAPVTQRPRQRSAVNQAKRETSCLPKRPHRPGAYYREPYVSRRRKRPFARLGSTLLQRLRDMFAKSRDPHDAKAVSRSVR
jgi:hypothetical protein